MKYTDTSDQSIRNWNAAKTVTLVTAMGSAVVVSASYISTQSFHWYWFVAFALNTILLAVSYFYRKMPVAISGAIFFFSLALVLFASFLTNVELAQSGVHIDPFGVFKIVALAAAILTPSPLWIGYFFICVCAVVPVVSFFLVFPSEFHAVFCIEEPWLTLALAIAALIVFRRRLKMLTMAEHLAHFKAQQQCLDDLARIFLGLRDLTNTPIQSMELTAHLLAEDKMSNLEGSKLLESALVRLRMFSQIIATYEHDIDWTKTEASFDAIKMLENALKKMGGNPL